MRRSVVTGRQRLSFNMTPMIDVIFLLIIFFLCVNQYQKADSAEQVVLPEASSEQVKTPEPTRHNPLVVNLFADGRMTIAGQVVSTEQLETALRNAQAELPALADGTRVPLEVWIRSDRSVPYGTVEPVLRTCAGQGIWKVAFKVLSPEQEAKREIQ